MYDVLDFRYTNTAKTWQNVLLGETQCPEGYRRIPLAADYDGRCDTAGSRRFPSFLVKSLLVGRDAWTGSGSPFISLSVM